MNIHWKARLGMILFLFPLASGGAWAAALASPLPAGAATRPATHSNQALPAALRPAFYRALARDADAAYAINQDGCAVLAKQKLKACFDAHGAHFTGATPVSLHLVAFGRSGDMTPVGAVRPTIHGNRVGYERSNLTAWWRVLPMGFEQGFTIAERPAGHGDLTLALAASRQDAGAPGAGASTIRHSRESGNPVKTSPSIPLRPEGGKEIAWGKLRYGQLVVTDANGKVVPATLTSEGNRILIAVKDASAAYPLTVDPLVWIEQKVTASNGAAYDDFGDSVAVDGTTALIGAYGANGNQGAAYVFTESNGSWTQTQKLTASDGAIDDDFGDSVALDGTTALVGAVFATVNGNVEQGAAYVFTESNGSWTQTAKLTEGNDGAAFDAFGASVALKGATALVGAPSWTNDGSGLGAAYVFAEAGGMWSEMQKLTPSDGTTLDFFGVSVALDGTTALIGAPYASDGINNYQGAAYVFAETGGTWSEAQKLTTSDPGVSYFGSSVALDGTTALIGAAYTDVGINTDQGAAYVFAETGGMWGEVQKLMANDGAAHDNFGWSVALDGTTALVGADGATVNGHAFQGAAYVFDTGTWTQTQKLTASDGAIDDYFGYSVALDGPTTLVGALSATVDGNPDQGAAYFYGQSDLGLVISVPPTVHQLQQYISQTIVTNNDLLNSPAVTVTIPVPDETSFVSATPGLCSQSAGVVTCNFGSVPGNGGSETASVTLTATGAPGGLLPIVNSASIANATPPLAALAFTQITCQGGYTQFDGYLNAGETFTSGPITVLNAGQKYVDLTSSPGLGFFVITTTSYGTHTYVYPHAKHGHRWGAAGSYQVGVYAPLFGGYYTLCVKLNP